MKAFVDPDVCMGCGVCEGIAPDVFQMNDDNIAIVLVNPIPANLEADVRDAMDQCPEQAITIEE